MFKVGKRVVCVRNHSMGAVTVGVEYTICGIQYCMKCGAQELHVGLKKVGYVECSCGRVCEYLDNVWWLSPILFAPLEEKGETMIEEFFIKEPQSQN